MNQKTYILVVDDEPNIREVVELYLAREGFEVAVAADGEAAMSLIENRVPDLLVLDLMLPKLGGLEITRILHQSFNIPIIMLTAKGQEEDKITGLELGADDYVTKPFSPRELVARVKAVLRRGQPQNDAFEPAPVLDFEGIYINPNTRQVYVQDKPATLTAKEFDLLCFMANHPGQVFTRDQLLNHVWGYNFFGDASTVTVHMRRLREKVELDPTHPRFLLTVWGVGYKFTETVVLVDNGASA